MKAGTKFQVLIVGLDTKLPKITERHKQWAYNHCLEHQATILKSGRIRCLDCGNEWQATFKNSWKEVVCGAVCSSCGVKLKMRQTQSRRFNQSAYMTIIDTFKGYQIIRLCDIRGHYLAGTVAKKYCWEVSRIWIAPNGKYEIIGQLRGGYYNRYDSWTGDFCLRNKHTIRKHLIHPYKYYPKKKIIKEIKRNGVKSRFYNIHAFHLFHLILTESKFETLWKSQQMDLVDYALEERGFTEIKRFWASVRICIRNNYTVTDTSDWFDYLDLLEYFQMDLHSPKYVCNQFFKVKHDVLVEKKRKIKLQERMLEEREKLLEDQDQYVKEKKRFFGLEFIENELKINMIESIEKLMDIGDRLHHCIFVNEYHKRKGSLLLYASIDDKPIETIEVSLYSYEVLQSRGLLNKPTKYSQDVIKLVNKNLPLIEKIHKNKLKKVI